MEKKYTIIKDHPFLKLGKTPAKRDERNIRLAAVLYKVLPPVPDQGANRGRVYTFHMGRWSFLHLVIGRQCGG